MCHKRKEKIVNMQIPQESVIGPVLQATFDKDINLTLKAQKLIMHMIILK